MCRVTGVFLAVFEAELQTVEARPVQVHLRRIGQEENLDLAERVRRLEIGDLQCGLQVLHENPGVRVAVEELVQPEASLERDVLVSSEDRAAEHPDAVEGAVARDARERHEVLQPEKIGRVDRVPGGAQPRLLPLQRLPVDALDEGRVHRGEFPSDGKTDVLHLEREQGQEVRNVERPLEREVRDIRLQGERLLQRIPLVEPQADAGFLDPVVAVSGVGDLERGLPGEAVPAQVPARGAQPERQIASG